jgi:hypothetical protein
VTEKNRVRNREEAFGPPAAPFEAPSEVQGERAEEESGLRTASEIVAVVCASVLVGGGAGMLGGVALGAINPFFLGMVGIAVGAVASVPLGRAILKRPEGGTGLAGGPLPTQDPPDAPGDAQAATEHPGTGGGRRPWWRRVFGG